MWAFLTQRSFKHSLTYWCYVPLQKNRKYLQNSSFLHVSLNPSQFKGEVFFKSSDLRYFFPSSLTPVFKWVLNDSQLAKWSMMFPEKIITTHKSTPLHCQDQHHCTRTLSYRWVLLLTVDLSGSTGSHPKASPTRQCNCSENVLVVKHIKHVQSLQHLENKGVFILVGMLSEKCNLNTGREQCVLFRHTSSFFHSFPAAIITCVYPWAILSSAPRPALQSTSAFQPKAAEIREDAQVWVPEGLTLCTSYPAHHSCWENQKQHLRKFDKKPNVNNFNSEKSFTNWACHVDSVTTLQETLQVADLKCLPVMQVG